jgi:hypothetical protein
MESYYQSEVTDDYTLSGGAGFRPPGGPPGGRRSAVAEAWDVGPKLSEINQGNYVPFYFISSTKEVPR